jgi:putative oxidoreductase
MHHDPSAAQLAVQEYEARQRREHNLQQGRQAKLFTVGRIFISVLFIGSAIAKMADYSATVRALNDIIAAPEVLLPLGIAVELIGGTMLLFGVKARTVATGMIAYLACVTLLLLHDFSNPFARSFALSNLAFAGALLMIVAHGAGALSVDRVTGQR